MQINAFGITDIGQVRDCNEDAFLIDEQLQFYVVCDGMGGHAAGEIAAQNATEFVAKYFKNHSALISDIQASEEEHFKLFRLVEAATIETCHQLYQLANSQPEYAGMGTTMTVLIIAGSKAVMSHVGDSRLYLLRGKRMHLLSSDHTVANEMLQRGVVTEEEFKRHPFRHYLTRSVGSAEAVEPELLLFDIIPEDILLLCSDGLSRYFDDEKEIITLLKEPDLASTANKLVDLANDCGGRDNITAIVVQVQESQEELDEVANALVKEEALKCLFLCESLSYRRLIRLVEISELKEYPAGAMFLKENSACEGLYLLVEGKVEVSQKNKEPLELSKGQHFCETALVKSRQSDVSVRAIENTKVLIIRREKFQRLIRRLPKMGRALQANLLDYLSEQLDVVNASN